MNTTHKVSIGGMAFVVEESAYNELKSYIDKLESQFRSRVDGQEIISDIESRIAELINGKLLNHEQLVTLADIRDVLSQLGDPSEMDDSNEKTSEGQPFYGYATTSTRRFYRSADSKVIGGVCGGLGAYLGIDPVWLRVALAIFALVGTPFAFGWFFVVAYIVMWAVVPVAVTVSQKLEMEGKNVNVSTIEQRIREEARDLSPRVKTAGERLLGVIGIFVKIFAIFFISVFVITGLAVSVVLLVSLFGVDPTFWGVFSDFHNDTDFAIFNIAYNFFPNIFWFKASIFALVAIPTILLVTLAVKLLFRSRLRTRFVVIPLTVLWVVALFAALFTGVASFKKSFGSNNSLTETIAAPNPIDTLKIGYSGMVNLNSNDMLLTLRNRDDDDHDVNVTINGKNIVNVRHHNGWDDDNINVVSVGNSSKVKLTSSSVIYVRPLVNIEFSDNIDKPQVLVKKWATGVNYNVATQNAEDIKFSAVFSGDSLLITPATPIGMSERILKGVELTVLIPKGKSYTVSRDMLTSIKNYDCKRVNGVYVYDSNNTNDNEWDNVTDVDTVVVK